MLTLVSENLPSPCHTTTTQPILKSAASLSLFLAPPSFLAPPLLPIPRQPASPTRRTLNSPQFPSFAQFFSR